MTSFSVLAIAALMLVYPSHPVNAAAEGIAIGYTGAVGQNISIYQSADIHAGVEAAWIAFKNSEFSPASQPVLNFGIGSPPIWLALRIKNPEKLPVHRNLLFETSWLDKIDAYFFHQDRLIDSYHAGDRQPFSQRSINNRFFVFDHDYLPGETVALIRVETPDPMLLPIYFLDTEALTDRNILQAYSYGLVYGVILAMISYNLMLYVGMRSNHHLLYSIYLLFFLLMNVSYTGHGYQWLWSESPKWQQWLNPALMHAYMASGLIFALYFLNIKATFPTIYRIVTGTCVVLGILLLLSMFSTDQTIALWVAFICAIPFTGFMILLGVLSLRANNRYAKYFLLASISAVCGAAMTAAAVGGIIPFNLVTYRFIDIGMMTDAILLALALADRFNVVQREKMIAEKMAGTDALTGLNNRRSFYKFAQPIWSISLRNQSDSSAIMLDIDHFKSLNDRYGHAIGDRVLVQLADSLKKEARSGDILARWGGEEFLIFLPDTGLDNAIGIAERMRKKISTLQIPVDHQEMLTLTASFGAAHVKAINISLDELISKADQQLYRAKRQGRNCVCTDSLE
jgi:diguanylate cyclase (GGDEF)-like protein